MKRGEAQNSQITQIVYFRPPPDLFRPGRPKGKRARKMMVSERCVAAVKHFEGFRSEAYQDMGGVWTIGYGQTDGVHQGDVTSEAAADEALRHRLRSISAMITAKCSHSLTQGMLDALCDFAYNLGFGALLNSTMWKLLNAGRSGDAAAEFLRWVHVGGVVAPGLVKRRSVERSWFLESGESKIAA